MDGSKQPPGDAPPDPHLFIFKTDKAIQAQVIDKLENSPLLRLEKNVGPPESGIYALYFKSKTKPIYVGKASSKFTKSSRTLRARLNEHVSKLSDREGLDLKDMAVRYLTFESEWYVIAAEFALMDTYKPEWNDSGFGSKTPGKGRPGLADRPNKWAVQFPKKAGAADENDDD